jgi:DNA-directed RNA polymerase subunit RPC12/RpoP
MDIVFNCPNCDQELAVDSAGSGSEIECPACNHTITIPAAGKATTGSLPAAADPTASAPSAITTSAAAKVEMHLKVPVHDKPVASLIAKPAPPLEAVAKGAGKKLRCRTIRHANCVESGHDKFDERVTEFLSEIGESNIVSIHTVSYEFFDVGTQKIITDYGLSIIYRG